MEDTLKDVLEAATGRRLIRLIAEGEDRVVAVMEGMTIVRIERRGDTMHVTVCRLDPEAAKKIWARLATP